MILRSLLQTRRAHREQTGLATLPPPTLRRERNWVGMCSAHAASLHLVLYFGYAFVARHVTSDWLSSVPREVPSARLPELVGTALRPNSVLFSNPLSHMQERKKSHVPATLAHATPLRCVAYYERGLGAKPRTLSFSKLGRRIIPTPFPILHNANTPRIIDHATKENLSEGYPWNTKP